MTVAQGFFGVLLLKDIAGRRKVPPGKILFGYSQISDAVLNLCYPILSTVGNLAYMGYIVSAALHIVMVIGVLMLYREG